MKRRRRKKRRRRRKRLEYFLKLSDNLFW